MGLFLKKEKINNETLREDVKEWLADEKLTKIKYGYIYSWDTSEATDMSKLF